MLVTAAPCAIKGAAIDCLRGCLLEREGYTKKEEDRSRKKALPLARIRRPSAPDLGIDLLCSDVSLYLALC